MTDERLHSVLRKLRDIFGEGSAHEQFIRDVRCHLRRTDNHITVSQLRRWTSLEPRAADECARWFSSSALPLLRERFFLFVEEDEQRFLTSEEVEEMFQHEVFVFDTGDTLEGENLFKSVYPCYEPTDELLEIIDDAESA